MKNKLFPFIGVLSAAAIYPASTIAQKAKQPNILFIIADDMGYGDLACYGNPYIKTPNIDRLAAQGVRFTQGYAGSAVSSPSRCTLLTGMHTGHSRIRNNFVDAEGITGLKGNQTIRRQHLTPSDTTLATVFKQNGYITGLMNKWHQDGFNPEAGPLDCGFDEFRGWLISTSYSNDPYYYPEWRFHQRELIKIKENENGAKMRHNNDITTEDAIEFIDRNHKKPFFLYLAYDSPHEPYNIEDTSPYDSYAWDPIAKRYASLITSMDNNIGRVLKRLDELKISDNTIIVFVSDNGGAVMAPHKTLHTNSVLRGRKGNFYEGGIRVPVIVKVPGVTKGTVSAEPLYFPDFMPTLAAMTSSRTPQGIDGKDLTPIIKGEKTTLGERVLYWEFPGSSYALRRGEWKIVCPGKGRDIELYNIHSDISESENLASTHPEVVAELDALAKTSSGASPNFPKGWAGFKNR